MIVSVSEISTQWKFCEVDKKNRIKELEINIYDETW